MTMPRLHVLGTLSVEDERKPVPIALRKAKALLVYLALTGRAHRREALVALFCPELSAAAAHAELWRCLYVLRKSLGTSILVTELDTVAVDPDRSSLWVDALHFRDLLSTGDMADLRSAADLYQGDLLAGFTLADAPDFEEWRYFEAERLRQAQVHTLERLVRWHTGQRQYGEAIDYAQRRLAMDVAHEPTQRDLMRIYAWRGQPGAAKLAPAPAVQ